MEPRAIWYTGQRGVAIRPAKLGEGELLLRMVASGLSRGTERIVWSGAVPESERTRMALQTQEGDFGFPVKYGYAAVARIEEGPERLRGRLVFAMHPHQTLFRLPLEAVHVLPSTLPPARATLAANMETALNAIWDAQLRPGSRVAVIGAGLVGCLTAYLAARIGKAKVTLADKIESRQTLASELRVSFASAKNRLSEMSTVFHCSASAGGLAAAIDALEFEGQVIEMSWYGAEPVPVPLGGAFHANRLSIRCSQVGHVAPGRRASVSHAERMRTAIGLLDDPALDALVTHHMPFEEAETLLPERLTEGADGIATAITYG
ncbi:zinc-dependent alcohol dehydrogenase [Pontivivens ytuae]|uniref:Zinc-binding alcohol dehydrogenase n=1 Tax=Pontivivens ytuae TaxID=2789856 RepID=A0A7S9LPB4_9RHOB|nr:zinc-binding alcohol dehydrogenase [Pontivivens ytuae]QPH52784.1 zinc-binding alcohol dehydrogenase [Pontivivens ytuae]